MKAFKFEFERVLNHKRTVEDLARRDWAEAQARVDRGLQELEGMYALIDDTRVQVSEMTRSGAGNGPQLAQLDEFVNGQKVRIERFRQKLRELMSEAERLREILVAAARERKTFEKLKEKRFEEFKDARMAREVKQMDDLAVMRFKKASGEGL
jgi:flagellar protein FliJ